METWRFDEKTHAKNLVFTGDSKGNMGKSIKLSWNFQSKKECPFEYAARA
jgi:hypothetical protein